MVDIILVMERYKVAELLAWKNSRRRKPLVLMGARQVGKTWLLKDFGARYYKQCIYINFEKESTLQDLFDRDFNPERIVQALQIHAQTQIEPKNTLIVFDEIQAVPRGITSLKYFCEDAPEYHVIAAGSLLGMDLHENVSFPVGKVNFMELRPLSFYEFLEAQNEKQLVKILQNGDWKTLEVYHEKLVEQLKWYFYVGGMPEAVETYIKTKDLELVRKVQQEILSSYDADFSKHVPKDMIQRLHSVWNSLPAQLAKENKKFVYGVIREGARAKDYELAIEWLCRCGLFLRARRSSKPSIPLSAYQDLAVFKLFLSDVGLLAAMTSLDARILLEKNRIFTEFKGALTEQYVMQQLRLKADDMIGYWTNERSTAEVDFLVQRGSEIIPVEVKAEVNVHSRSFRMFCDKYKPEKAVRFSMLPYREEDWMTNRPLYAVETPF